MSSATCCGRPVTKVESMHRGLHDRLFGVPGEWSITRCADRRCDLMRLHPAPDARAIAASYDDYYTHAAAAKPVADSGGGLRRNYAGLKAAYLSGRYGYPLADRYRAWGRWGRALYFFPVRRSEVDDEVRRIAAMAGGRLLDVGCGSGAWLARMRSLGWAVAGVDLDVRAVATARSLDLAVGCGTLVEQHLPAAHFDVLTLHHVIEHVQDPIELLTECRRLLKPEGRLILATPNSRALGHRLLGRAWRGLEPPRHLQIFGPAAMRHALAAAGFEHSRVRTLNSRYIWTESLRLRYRALYARRWGRVLLQAAAEALTRLEQLWLLVCPDVGECLAVESTAPPDRPGAGPAP